MKKSILLTVGILTAFLLVFFGLRQFYRPYTLYLEMPMCAEDGETLERVVVDITWRRQFKGFHLVRRVQTGTISDRKSTRLNSRTISIGDKTFYHLDTMDTENWDSTFSTAGLNREASYLNFYSFVGQDGKEHYYIEKYDSLKEGTLEGKTFYGP